MGFWNAHGSVGNIVGKLFSTAMMHQYGWQWGFMSMGMLCAAVGIMELAFVIPQPHDVLTPPEMAELERANAKGHIAKVAEVHEQATAAKLAGTSGSITPGGSISQRRGVELDVTPAQSSEVKLSPAISHSDMRGGGGGEGAGFQSASHPRIGEGSLAEVASARHHDEFPSISFTQALRVPGVFEYSACLFFSKLVAYAFIFWLPYYLASPKLNYSDNEAGNVSTVYDVGGVAGGIIAGWASDVSGKRGVVSGAMLLLCLPGLYIYSVLAQYGLALNIILMFVVGILVNGQNTHKLARARAHLRELRLCSPLECVLLLCHSHSVLCSPLCPLVPFPLLVCRALHADLLGRRGRSRQPPESQGQPESHVDRHGHHRWKWQCGCSAPRGHHRPPREAHGVGQCVLPAHGVLLLERHDTAEDHQEGNWAAKHVEADHTVVLQAEGRG